VTSQHPRFCKFKHKLRRIETSHRKTSLLPSFYTETDSLISHTGGRVYSMSMKVFYTIQNINLSTLNKMLGMEDFV